MNVEITEVTALERQFQSTLVTATIPFPLHARRYARQWVEVWCAARARARARVSRCPELCVSAHVKYTRDTEKWHPKQRSFIDHDEVESEARSQRFRGYITVGVCAGPYRNGKDLGCGREPAQPHRSRRGRI